VTLGSEPGRDDSGLPPVNVRIPDDARELERDVLAYRRELRVRRRRALARRIFRPFAAPGAAVPLIAICAALSMVAGAMLSVLTISPASAPTRAPRPAVTAAATTHATSPASPATSAAPTSPAARQPMLSPTPRPGTDSPR
jgi:hypothetical protein